MKKIYPLLILFSVFLISADRVFDLGFVRSVASFIISPVSHGLYSIGIKVNQEVEFVVSLPKVYRENQSLKQEIADLGSARVVLKGLQDENHALRAQLGVTETSEAVKILASVLGMVQDGDSITLILDKGEIQGVEPDLVVVIGDQLVGKVSAVNSGTAFVVPIFATESKVPVQVISSVGDKDGPIKGLVRGRFNDRIELTDILQEHELVEGDLVVTSGETGIFPPGLLVGKVKLVVSKDSEIFQVVELDAFWELGMLGTVFVYE